MRKDSYNEHVKNGQGPIPGKILFVDSFKANLMALLAHVYIYTHGRYDVTEYSKQETDGTFDVLLGHGVTGLKKKRIIHKNGDVRTVVGCAKDADLVVASSEAEGKIKCEEWNIPEEKLAITGLPRYDRLARIEHKTTGNGEILYVPTWRQWELMRFSVEMTSYFKNIKAFILDSGLNEYLKTKGHTVLLYVHVWMRDFYEDLWKRLSSKGVKVLPPNAELQEFIISSSMLVTDYSSVCWDFLYLEKPVVFFQYDVEEYLKEKGSYIDLKKDLFGPVAYTPDEAASSVKEIVENNFSVKKWDKKRKEMLEYAFKYRDKQNCERLIREILKRCPHLSKCAIKLEPLDQDTHNNLERPCYNQTPLRG
jgi:CDP-glycerol glycerophosphotransferase (TagB/SpsB family)